MTILLKSLILALSLSLAYTQTQTANITDYLSKGNDALYAIANLTTHIPLYYQVYQRTSDDLNLDIMVFDQVSSYLAAGGFIAVNPHLIEEKKPFYSMNTIDKMHYMLSSSYNNTAIQSLLSNYSSDCARQYPLALSKLRSSFQKLFLYTRAKKGIDNVDPFSRLTDFLNECNNSACRNVTRTLIAGLTGGQDFKGFQCDLLEIQYNGYMKSINTTLYRGDRDRITSTNGYLLSLLGTAVVIESAFETMQYSDISRWQTVQNRNQMQLKLAIQRVRQMDKQIQDLYMNNAQYSVNYLLSYNNYTSSKQLLDSVSTMLNSTYSNNYWVVQVFKPQVLPYAATTFYYNSFNSFTTTDHNNGYFVWVGGIPYQSTPYSDYLNAIDWVTIANSFNNTLDLSVSLFNGYCLSGVQAVNKSEIAETYIPSWTGIKTVQSASFNLILWNTQEQCKKSSSATVKNMGIQSNLIIE